LIAKEKKQSEKARRIISPEREKENTQNGFQRAKESSTA